MSGRRFHVREMLTHMQFKEILKTETLKMNGATNKHGGGSFTVCMVPDTHLEVMPKLNNQVLRTLMQHIFPRSIVWDRWKLTNVRRYVKVLRQQVRWRDMINKSFYDRYDDVRNYVIGSKYRLGTQDLRRIVEQSFDKYTRYSWSDDVVKDWFQAPANAEGIVEMVEAFIYDGGNLMKDWMDKRKDAVRTYETEFHSVLRALDNHWEDIKNCNDGRMIRHMLRTKQVSIYGDDTYIEVIVKAYMEHNGELRINASKAFWEYRNAMKPFYKYQWYNNEGREKKRKTKP